MRATPLSPQFFKASTKWKNDFTWLSLGILGHISEIAAKHASL